VRATDKKAEVALALRGSNSRSMVILKPRQALLHARYPWLEFMFFDKALGISVDEATDAAPQGCDLLVQAGKVVSRDVSYV
jgi:hypothetical protein